MHTGDMPVYFGCATPKNRLRWIIFSIFIFFTVAIFAVFVPSNAKCEEAIERVEGGSSMRLVCTAS